MYSAATEMRDLWAETGLPLFSPGKRGFSPVIPLVPYYFYLNEINTKLDSPGRMIRVLLMIISVVWQSLIHGQYYFYDDGHYAGNTNWEAGVSVGLMNCLTDLGGRAGKGAGFVKDVNWRMSKPCISTYIIASYRDLIGFRFELMKGRVESSDALLAAHDPDLSGRYGRNLSFRSNILEMSVAMELHPLFFKRYETDEAPRGSPFLLFGLGAFHFDPRALLNGKWHRLQPLRLEGQGFDEYPGNRMYHLWQLNIPLSIGIRYEINSFMNARVEIMHRFLFTDYLDDVSKDYIDEDLFDEYLSVENVLLAKQLHNRAKEIRPGFEPGRVPRGNEKINDSYFSVCLKFGMILKLQKKIRN